MRAVLLEYIILITNSSSDLRSLLPCTPNNYHVYSPCVLRKDLCVQINLEVVPYDLIETMKETVMMGILVD